MKKANGGFTLIELVVVIVILGILAAVAVPKFFDMSGEAEQAAAQGVAGAISSASSVNFAARKVRSNSAVDINATNVCDSTVLGGIMQGGFPSGFTVAEKTSGSGACNGSQESATCTVTKGAKTADAVVVCARP